MTSVVEVLRGEMVAETGVDALGYAQPDKDRILVRKGLPAEARKVVLGHEFEHMAKGEEGPFGLLESVILGGGALLGGILGGNAAEDAADAVVAGQDAGIAEQRRQFDAVMAMLQPQIQTGNAARDQLAALFGLPVYREPYPVSVGTSSGTPSGVARSMPGRPRDFMTDPEFPDAGMDFTPGGQTASGQVNPSTSLPPSVASQEEAFDNFFTSPQYQWTLDEATRGVEGAAAARGGALSGGALRAIQDRSANIASGEFQTYVNNLLQLASGGGAATGAAVNVSQNTGNAVSNLLSGQGQARASGILGQANTLGNTINSLGFILGNTDWDLLGSVAGSGGGTGGGGYGLP